VGRGEQEWSRPLDEDVAEALGTGHVAAEHADGLGERADLDRHPAVQPVVVDRPAAAPAEHARRVSVVDHDGRAVFLRRIDDAGQRRDVTVHREDAVGDDEDEPERLAGAAVTGLPGRAQDLAKGSDVGVRKDLPRRLREPHAVDDRGMVELVGHDQVRLAGDRREHARVRREPALERQHRLDVLEPCEVRFEVLVEGHRPGDRSHRSGTRPVQPHRVERGLSQSRVVGQPEIVVGREADEAPVVDRDDRALRR
jgi:hypothetical protein